MSRLDELIKEYCPNGVTHLPLEEVAHYSKTRIPLSEININTYIGVENLLQNKQGKTVASSIPTSGTVIGYEKGDILIGNIRPYLKKIWLANCTGGTNGDVLTIQINNKEKITPNFLFYILSSEAFFDYDNQNAKGAKMPRGNKDAIMKYIIPIPPIEVQNEIVRILDEYTARVTALQKELEAELTARRKQYEYYRDKLLSFDVHGGGTGEVEWRTLGEIATSIYRGSGITRDQVTATGIQCVRYGEIYTTYNTWFDKCVSHTDENSIQNPKYFEHGDILFAITGESVEDIAKSVAYLGKEKCLAGGDIVVLKHNQNPRYLAHALSTYDARKQKSKGKIKSKVVHSSVPSIESIRIPVPSLEVQARIADVLDNFDAICSDLSIGLPAEIEARQKQYEYYRDALLSFDNSYFINVEREREREWRSGLIKLWQYVFGVAYLPIEKAFDIRNGYTPSKSNDEYWTNGTVDWFRMEDIRTNGHILSGSLQKVSESAVKKSGKIPANSIALATSATIGEHALITIECLGNQRFTFFSAKQELENTINMNYMNYYFFKIDEWCKDHLFQGNFNTVDVGALKKLVIPIPNIVEQTRIAEVLDRFNSLCNDISEGLPAEIEARQKQYEYYRDKLLSFKEL